MENYGKIAWTKQYGARGSEMAKERDNGDEGGSMPDMSPCRIGKD